MEMDIMLKKIKSMTKNILEGEWNWNIMLVVRFLNLKNKYNTCINKSNLCLKSVIKKLYGIGKGKAPPIIDCSE